MYKKFLLLFLLFFCTSLTPKVFSQVPTTIRTVASLPATCHGGNRALPSDEVMLVTGGVGYQYVCGSSNTWVQNSTALLLSNNNTWTGTNTFDAVVDFTTLTSLSANTPTALCALCMGPTDVILAGCSGCNTSLTRNGQSSLNITTGQGTSGPLLVGDYEGASVGYGPAGSQSIWSNQSANSDLDGELTMSSGTATYTFSTSNTYTVHPICTANDNTAIAAVQVTYTGTTSVTFHTSGSSDVVEYHCHGRN
jgi:hypothetical protein